MAQSVLQINIEFPGERAMPLWQRMLITLAMMLLTSFAVGQLWHWMFSNDMPSYLSGVIGGITAVVVWEFMKRVELR